MGLENEYNLLEMMNETITGLEMTFKPRIFRPTALKTFLARSLAEMNPDLSMAGTTIDYYGEVF